MPAHRAHAGSAERFFRFTLTNEELRLRAPLTKKFAITRRFDDFNATVHDKAELVVDPTPGHESGDLEDPLHPEILMGSPGNTTIA